MTVLENYGKDARPGRVYGRAAHDKSIEAAGYSRELDRNDLVVSITVIALSLLDIVLFYEPVTSVLFNTSPLLVGILCVACAAGPIVTAAATARFVRKLQYGDEAGAFEMAVTALLAITTIALLTLGWGLRARYWDDETGVGVFLNALAIAFAVVAFVAEFLGSFKRMRLRALRDEAEVERDLLERLDFKEQFSSMHESDELRRAQEDESYDREVRSLAEQGVQAFVKGRKALVRRAAKGPEDLDFIMGTPFRIGSDDVFGGTQAELVEKVRNALGAPTLEDIRDEWGSIPNSRHLGEKQLAELASFEERLESIRSGGRLPDDARSGEEDDQVGAQSSGEAAA